MKTKGMIKEHVISDDLFAAAHVAFLKGDHWVAYNTIPYFLEKGDIYFFKAADEAYEFSDNNISEYDDYQVLHAYSTDELLKRISYGENLERQLANPDANGLYNTDGNSFTDALIDHIEQQQILNNKNVSIMNQQNFEYLKDNIKYLGFGEKQHDELEAHLKEGKESFQMTYATEVNKKPFEAVLNFRKSDKSDMVFLNSYQATLERSNGEKMEQTFYLNKGKGVTAKEAYNLLEGRAVHKELTNKAGEPYKAWIQLDFENKDKHNNHEVKQYHENYGYDLKAAIGKFGVMELDGGEKEKNLLHSLQKGNIQSVTMIAADEPQKMFIEANPEFKTINVYDDKMHRLDKEERLDLLEKTAVKELKEEGLINDNKESQELKPEMKNGKEVKEDQIQKVKQDNKKTAKQKTDKNDSLLPKKRVGQKKGLKIP